MARTSTSELLGVAREKPASLVPDPKMDLRRFRLSATSQLGTKRIGVGRGAFIDSVLGAIDGFYESVLQGLRPWVAKAPQLPKGGSALAEAGIDTTVSPDEQEPLESSDGETEAGSADPVAPPESQPDGSADLVSWDSAEAGIEQERKEGFPAQDEGTPSSDKSSVFR